MTSPSSTPDVADTANTANTADLPATYQTLMDTLSATDLFNLHRVLSTHITRAAYPSLTLVTDHPDGEDEPADYGFKCPHCQQVMDELTILDVAKRYVSSGSIREDDVAAKTLTVYYDGSADFEPCVYLCTDCRQPVALPDGWVEA